ncbi:MAG: LPS assembly lipoprotein LptE [Rhodocyclaceae bacterium]
MNRSAFLAAPRAWRMIVAAMLALTLTACGFQLRGPRPMPFSSIYLAMNPYSELTVDIKRQLRANGGMVIAERADQAQVQLVVANDSREKAILSLKSDGSVREYQLRQHFAFRLLDSKGLELMPYNDIYVYRDITFNDSQTLAKEQEEGQLYRDMEHDVVQQLIRRLSTAKVPMTADQSAPAAQSVPAAR